jgi:hypothetical protein
MLGDCGFTFRTLATRFNLQAAALPYSASLLIYRNDQSIEIFLNLYLVPAGCRMEMDVREPG